MIKIKVKGKVYDIATHLKDKTLERYANEMEVLQPFNDAVANTEEGTPERQSAELDLVVNTLALELNEPISFFEDVDVNHIFALWNYINSQLDKSAPSLDGTKQLEIGGETYIMPDELFETVTYGAFNAATKFYNYALQQKDKGFKFYAELLASIALKEGETFKDINSEAKLKQRADLFRKMDMETCLSAVFFLQRLSIRSKTASLKRLAEELAAKLKEQDTGILSNLSEASIPSFL